MPKPNAKTIKPLKKYPTGIKGLDEITLGGLPQHRSTLICGGAGSGKSLFGMEFLLHGAVLYHEPGLFVAFEETEEELLQNVDSLGFDVNHLVSSHQLVIDDLQIDQSGCEEIGAYNLDRLFVRLADAIDTYKIKRLVIDTIEALFSHFTNELILRAELQRLFRWFKNKNL